MADTVAKTTVFQSKTNMVVSSVFTLDGTEAADLILVDRSAITGPDNTEPGKLVIERIEYSIAGCSVLLEFEHTTDDPIAILQGYGVIDYTKEGRYPGFIDPNSAGGTGDIVATTLTTDAGDTAYILLFLRKKD